MYKYEMHLHTHPVSKCSATSIIESMDFYKEIGYDGIFLTNHFLDGNINIDSSVPYEERLNFYFSDYEKAVEYGDIIGLKAFFGVELSYGGTDFLIYGLDKEWYFDHPEIMNMEKSKELEFMIDNGAFVVQAHPYREASYIDHIRLYPRQVHGVEVVNANNNDIQNKLAKFFAESYGLIEIAGSDNHTGRQQKTLAGMCSETPLENETDFIQRLKNRKMQIFTLNID